MTTRQTAARDRRQTLQARSSALAGSRLPAAGVRAEATPADSSETDETHGELWLYGVVGGWWFGFDAEDVAYQLRQLDVDHLTVRLHSPGGNAIEGIAIGNLLRNHPARVQVVVDGLAASAASIIALAGDEVVMSPGAQFMIHDPWMLTVGNEAELRADADFIGKQATNYAEVYALRATGKSADEWRDVMRAESWFTAQESVDEGLADRVGTVTAVGTPPPAPQTDLDDEDVAARAAWDLEVLVHPAARAAWRDSSGAPKPPSARPRSGSTTPSETESAVAFSDEQMKTMRAQLGLPETADEAAITAAITAVVEDSLEDSPQTPETSAAVPDGHVVLPAPALADLQAQAAAGAAAAETLRQRDRDTFLAEHADRFPPASKAAWSAAYDKDPKGTREYLASAPVLVPLEELGHAEDTSDADLAASEDYWFSGFALPTSAKG